MGPAPGGPFSGASALALARGAAGGGMAGYRESLGKELQGSQNRVGTGRTLRSALVWSERTFAGHLDMAWVWPRGQMPGGHNLGTAVTFLDQWPERRGPERQD